MLSAIRASVRKSTMRKSQMRARVMSTEVNPKTLTKPNPRLSAAFEFTRDDGILNQTQRQFYEDNGFIVMRKMVSLDKIKAYEERFRDIANGKVKVPGLVLQKEVQFLDQERSENTIYKLQELFMDEEHLFKYCCDPNILDVAQSFTGPNIMAIHTMLINKPPDSGAKSSRHPLHQDLLYFPFRPVNPIVCAWTAMGQITRKNGCLVAIPGSHRQDLLAHSYPEWEKVNAAFYGIHDIGKDIDRRVHIEMNAGDTIFFHPLLIHGSGMNRTDGYRKAISCHYAASECDYIDVKGTYQQELGDEIVKIGQSKYQGIEGLDYAFIWKMRVRLVRGEKKRL